MNQFKIGELTISRHSRCFIIAEAGFNHNGKFDLAQQLVDAAQKSGACAVKFQTFRGENLVSKKAKTYGVRDKNLPEFQYELYNRFTLTRDEYQKLITRGRKKKFEVFSTPFDEKSADLLDQLGVNVFKIASCDLTNLPLVRHIARKGKPILMSCGMSTFKEIGESLRTIYKTGNKKIVLLHCVSKYPAEPIDMNLRRMVAIRDEFKTLVGLSDHTDNNYTSFAAVALGARVIEKHFTLNRSMKGVDHYFSLDPHMMADLSKGVRAVEDSLGSVYKGIAKCETKVAKLARRSLFAVQQIKKGETIRCDMIAAKRPGTGIAPKFMDDIIGKIARCNIESETLLTRSMFAQVDRR